MIEVTHQERLALLVLCGLMTAGAAARIVSHRDDARDRLSITAEAADSLNPRTSGSLVAGVERELALSRVRATPLRDGERIDPNLAPPEQLARLPGVGPALADRIVSHRTEHGPFRTLGDLRSVPGIGPAMLARIGPRIALPADDGWGGATSAALDVNHATAAELEALPGVGPALAGRIVGHRDQHGPFRSLGDLGAVPGVGPAMLARIGPLVTLPAGRADRISVGAGREARGVARGVPAAPAGGARPGGNSPPIDLNRATAAELEALPGVGPALAGRIVADRAARGPFRSWSELERVSGIGPRLRERIQSVGRLGG